MKFAITVSFLLSFIICFSQTGFSQKWVKITKKDYTIQSPADWTIDSSKQMGTDLVLFSMLENGTDKFRENVNVHIQDITGINIDLGKYTAISEGRIKAMSPDSRIEETKTLNTGKATFQKIIYTATQSGFKLKFEQYYYVAAEKAYTVTLTTEVGKFEIFKPTGEQVLHSFALTGN
jgi:hypothetical protein